VRCAALECLNTPRIPTPHERVRPSSTVNNSWKSPKVKSEAFAARSVRYALIGGLAFLLRGRPRFTRDVDFLIEIPQVVLPGLLDDLVERGFSLDPAVVTKQ
jgi:hypothetical protein